jgi:hypothetical protein
VKWSTIAPRRGRGLERRMDNQGSPLRVAVCLSGQMREFGRAAPLYKKYLYDRFRPDIFVHTWSDRGGVTQPERLMPRGVNRLSRQFPNSFKRFKDYLNEAYENTTRPINLISDAQISEMIPYTKAVVEDFPKGGTFSLYGKAVPPLLMERVNYLDRVAPTEESIKLRALPGVLPMFYKIWACHKLMKEYEEQNQFQYDIVIRIRPDLLLRSAINNIQLPDDGEIFYSAPPGSEWFYKSRDRMCDQLWIGSRSAMETMSSVWEKIDLLFHDMASDESWTGLFGGEVFSARWAKLNRLTPSLFHGHSRILRERLDARATWMAMKAMVVR